MSRSLAVYVMGVPGTGKTTFAQALSNDLGTAPVLTTDLVKAMLEDRSDDPIFGKVSHTAWELLGDFSESNLLQGYDNFSRALFRETQSLVLRLLKTYRVVIVEGLGLCPELMAAQDLDCLPILLLQSDPERFQRRKLRLRHERANHWQANDRSLDLIEQHLLREAERHLPHLVRGQTAGTAALRENVRNTIEARLALA